MDPIALWLILLACAINIAGACYIAHTAREVRGAAQRTRDVAGLASTRYQHTPQGRPAQAKPRPMPTKDS